MTASTDDVVLVEGRVTTIAGHRVGCGNVWARPYVRGDGRAATGLTAALSIASDPTPLVVGLGSVVTIGEVPWRVDAIEKREGAPGRVQLGDARTGPRIDGVDFGDTAAILGFVARRLSSDVPSRDDDRLPIDGVDRLYARALAIDAAAADRLSQAIAEGLTAEDERVVHQVLLFFEWRPMAAGGERLGGVIVAHPERFPRERSTLSSDRITIRERAISVALRWGTDEHPRADALVRLARTEALAGYGAGFVDWLIAADRDWGAAHEATLVDVHPEALGDLYAGLRALGRSPAAAVARLLERAPTERGRRQLSLALRFERALDPEARARLMETVEQR